MTEWTAEQKEIIDIELASAATRAGLVDSCLVRMIPRGLISISGSNVTGIAETIYNFKTLKPSLFGVGSQNSASDRMQDERERDFEYSRSLKPGSEEYNQARRQFTRTGRSRSNEMTSSERFRKAQEVWKRPEPTSAPRPPSPKPLSEMSPKEYEASKARFLRKEYEARVRKG